MTNPEDTACIALLADVPPAALVRAGLLGRNQPEVAEEDKNSRSRLER